MLIYGTCDLISDTKLSFLIKQGVSIELNVGSFSLIIYLIYSLAGDTYSCVAISLAFVEHADEIYFYETTPSIFYFNNFLF